MRILIVLNTVNDSRSVSGGVIEYVHMANAWMDAGHQTDFFIAKAGWPQLRQRVPRARLLNGDGIFDFTNFLAKTWLYFPAYAYRMLTPYWVRLPERYEIVYSASQFIVDIHAARVLSRRLGAKLVVKVQHLLSGQAGRTGLLDRLFTWAEKKSAVWINRDADLLMCLSSTVGKDYERFEESLHLPRTPIELSGCGIDIARFRAIATAQKSFDVVLLGRMHEQKGIFDLPHVWKLVLDEIPSARLVVIGEGPHRLRTEQMFSDLGIKDSALFTGAIPEPEKNRLLGESKIGLSLSFEEGWGLSITEFLATGLPVVAYELPVFSEVFPGQLELVPLGGRKEAAAKVLALLQNESSRIKLGEQGRQFVARYDFKEIAAEEMRRLQRIANAP